MDKKRKLAIKKLYRITKKFAQEEIEQDWDVESEEKAIQEEEVWSQKEMEEERLRRDKIERLRSERLGWHEDDSGLPPPKEASQMYEEWFARTPQGGRARGIARSLGVEGSHRFLAENFPIIKRIINRHGGKTPKYLGSGAEGTAWELGDGMVLKIFFDTLRINVEQYEQDVSGIYKKDEFGSFHLMVHEYGNFKPVNIKTIWHSKETKENLGWAVMEKFKPVEEIQKENNELSLKRVINIINRELIDAPTYDIKKTKDKEERIHKIEELAYMIEFEIKEKIFQEELDYTKEALDLSDDWLFKLIMQFLYRTFELRQYDLHIGNLGLRESTGEFIFFDG